MQAQSLLLVLVVRWLLALGSQKAWKELKP